MFQCQHSLAEVIIWRVNGIPLERAANFSNVSVTSFVGVNGVSTHLSIGTLLVYNGTTIDCVAVFIDGSSSPQYTAPVALLIQGIIIVQS